MPTKHRIFTTSVAKVYPYYIAKAEKKGRTKAEVDAIICWLTGYSQRHLEQALKKQTDSETFFKEAPQPHPSRASIKGVICGVRIEEIQEPTMGAKKGSGFVVCVLSGARSRPVRGAGFTLRTFAASFPARRDHRSQP